MKMQSLRILDLFSGIGGFSHCLKSIGTTVAYCEKCPEARRVLENLFEKSLLDRAPIFEDICKLDGTKLKAIKPNMITAGFPCTDISLANVNGCGLDGSRSGLFYEIMRIVDQVPSVQCLFLENSHAIVSRGLDKVIDEITKRGFIVKWTIVSAEDVGAFHQRKRWYCLCVKPKFLRNLCEIPAQDTRFPFEHLKKIPRVIRKPEKESEIYKSQWRCRLLGNSIVPQAAALCWNTLYASYAKGDKSTQNVIIPDAVKKHPRLNLEITDGQNTFHKRLWATPTFHTWCILRCVTSDRCKTLLPIQLYYEKETQIEGDKCAVYKKYLCNPLFIECLMGYPKNWTSIEKEKRTKKVQREEVKSVGGLQNPISWLFGTRFRT